MDELIEKLKTSFSVEPMLNRVIQNISQQVSNTNYHFTHKNNDYKKIKMVEERFKDILKNSYYNDKTFFKEHILNLIKYSNSFSIPIRNQKTKELERIIIVQNKGWEVKSAFGTTIAKEFIFKPNGSNGNFTVYQNEKDIWHYKFNKESDEIFGMPLWVSVIPYLNIYSNILKISARSYAEQSNTRTIYSLGVGKNGSKENIKPETFDQLRRVLSAAPNEDLVVDFPILTEKIRNEYNSPEKLINALEMQIIAGLYTSKSQLGSSGAGRQDAETQQENTNSIIKDFKAVLQNSINNTIIREICKDLFGDFNGNNEVTLEFKNDFNESERQEKHATYLFQGGVIGLKECRNMCGLTKPLNKQDTFSYIYGKNQMDGTVENTNNPTNQYGTNQTTKKTKKD